MTRVALIGGYYVAPNIVANAQRCLNLYPEANPQDAPVPFTDYPTPGSRTLSTYSGGGCRCLYTATNGELFAVWGRRVYYINSAWTGTLLGTLNVNNGNMASMADNGTTILLVDGSPDGYTIDLATHAFAQIVDPAFYGANRVDFLSTFFLLNKPDTGEFYCSDSNAVTFDPLFFATKITYADKLAAPIALNQEVWLLGAQESSEVWVLAGSPDFPFQRLPSVAINHGVVATYSVSKIGTAIYWLSRDLNGQAVWLKGADYQGLRISTPAMEAAIQKYSRVDDAISYTYQQNGHQFVVLTFPAADKTWVYDATTNLIHERCWVDGDGIEHRVRGQCMAFAYGKNVAGDWETATLRELTLDLDTDDGVPMKFVRSFPHMIQDGDRVKYRQFIADMAVGTGVGSSLSELTATEELAPDGFTDTVLGADGLLSVIIGTDPASIIVYDPPLVSLRWSDSRGAAWGSPITGSMGKIGEYLTQIQWQRLGMARDRVFELSWSGNTGRNALNGAFVETTKAGS